MQNVLYEKVKLCIFKSVMFFLENLAGSRVLLLSRFMQMIP